MSRFLDLCYPTCTYCPPPRKATMTDTVTDARPSHQTIEEAFKPAQKILERLSDGIERREADRLVRAAEQVAHVARDKMRPPIGE